MAFRSDERNHGASYFATSFLSKQKQIVYNNPIHNLEDAELLQCPFIQSLVQAHVTGMLFVFSDLEDDIIAHYSSLQHT